MTEREIKELRDKIGIDPILTDEEIEYIWILMDKNTAIKPIGIVECVCPNCFDKSSEYFHYCPYCGQKLDWRTKWTD